MGDGRGWGEERAGDLLGRRAHISRSVRATKASGGSAGWQHVKIQTQSVVFHGSVLVVGRVGRCMVEPMGELAQGRIEPRPPAKAIDRLEPPSGDQP